MLDIKRNQGLVDVWIDVHATLPMSGAKATENVRAKKRMNDTIDDDPAIHFGQRP